MKTYTSFEEISADLKRLHLEKQIALEELKSIKYEVQEDLQPYNWIGTMLSAVRKYGIFYMIRKLIFRK